MNVIGTCVCSRPTEPAGVVALPVRHRPRQAVARQRRLPVYRRRLQQQRVGNTCSRACITLCRLFLFGLQ